MTEMTYPEFLYVMTSLEPLDYLPVYKGPGQFPSSKPLWRGAQHRVQRILFDAAVAGNGEAALRACREVYGDTPDWVWQRVIDAAEYWRSQGPQWTIPDGVLGGGWSLEDDLASDPEARRVMAEATVDDEDATPEQRAAARAILDGAE